jgi:hypothetical protein
MPVLGAVNDIYRVRSSTQDILKRALRLIGVVASGEPLPADQLKDGLEAFNDMVDVWNTEKLIIWVLARNTFTLTIGTNPFEIGPGVAAPGLNAPRPNRIEQGQAWITGGTLGTTETELEVLTLQQWASEQLPDSSGIPSELYYEPTFPLGKIRFDVKPDAAYTLILYLEQMLSQVFVDGTTSELALPPGYKDAIVHNLAIRLAPEYGKPAPPEVVISAVEGKASVKRLNQKPLYLYGDPELTARRGASLSDFLRGDF